jgi:hypothetical protein
MLNMEGYAEDCVLVNPAAKLKLSDYGMGDLDDCGGWGCDHVSDADDLLEVRAGRSIRNALPFPQGEREEVGRGDGEKVGRWEGAGQGRGRVGGGRRRRTCAQTHANVIHENGTSTRARTFHKHVTRIHKNKSNLSMCWRNRVDT